MSEFRFRKSSYSNPERECVEVATNVPAVIAVRDSKDPAGPVLRLTPGSWVAFRGVVVAGGFGVGQA